MKNKYMFYFLLTVLITAAPILSKENKANPTNYWPGKPWMCPDCHKVTDPLIHTCDKSEKSKNEK